MVTEVLSRALLKLVGPEELEREVTAWLEVRRQSLAGVWVIWPYGTVDPRRRSQPIRTHLSSWSRSTGPAILKRPAATSFSTRQAALANQLLAMTPAHSVRTSSRPFATSRGDQSRAGVQAVWRPVRLRHAARWIG